MQDAYIADLIYYVNMKFDHPNMRNNLAPIQSKAALPKISDDLHVGALYFLLYTV